MDVRLKQQAPPEPGQPPPQPETQYLVKWRGLPYSECTWELDKDLQPHGGPRAIVEWKVREAAQLTCRHTKLAGRQDSCHLQHSCCVVWTGLVCVGARLPCSAQGCWWARSASAPVKDAGPHLSSEHR